MTTARLPSVIRYLWASPATAIGVALAALLGRGGMTVVDGVLETHSPALSRLLSRFVPLGGGVAAITFGHVVLGRDEATLAATRAHERVHVAQYERWGPLFIPAYLLSGFWAFARGEHPYFDNVFERAARRSGSRVHGIHEEHDETKNRMNL